MEEAFIPIIAIVAIFIGLPWLIFHYVTKWKTAKTLTGDDEKLLDDLYEAARRLDDRLETIERIMTAENPDWKRSSISQRPSDSRLLDQIDALEDGARVGSRRKV
ncbi:MAG: envelope stress response membrane protein PspB [Sphingomicrobium sp.]